MLELLEYARREPLSQLILDPPEYLSANNGVVGLALKYDPTLVQQIEHQMGGLPGTIERSAVLAATLAEIARQIEGPSSKKGPDRDARWLYYLDHPWNKWRDLSYRRFGRSVSPIVVEISVGPEFPRSRSEPSANLEFWENYRIEFRRSSGPRLQYAEAGGCFLPVEPDRRRKWGTLGGFLQALDGQLYGVTAAHVAQNNSGFGTPTFAGAELLGLRSVLQLNSSRWSLPSRWSSEKGTMATESQPDRVSPNQCRVTTTPTTKGLDIALLNWPDERQKPRRKLSIVGIGEASQALPIRFFGARSGQRDVRISSLSIWHSYQMPDHETDQACVADCYQIRLRDRPYFRTNVSSGGDSGAWLLAETNNGHAWVGVLLGGDGGRSGIVPAQRIVDHFAAQLGPLTALV